MAATDHGRRYEYERASLGAFDGEVDLSSLSETARVSFESDGGFVRKYLIWGEKIVTVVSYDTRQRA